MLESDAYILGDRTRTLANAICGRRSFEEEARPILEALARATGETVILARLDDDRRHVRYAVVVETDSWLRFSVSVGTRRSLSSGASGHAVLAYLPEAERERYVASGTFEQLTANTVATRPALRKAIIRIRRDGAAKTVDGTVMGATGIAAPYFDKTRAVAGSVLVAAPTTRMLGREGEIVESVKRVADRISQVLANAGPGPVGR